jgi:hypothetical protein
MVRDLRRSGLAGDTVVWGEADPPDLAPTFHGAPVLQARRQLPAWPRSTMRWLLFWNCTPGAERR